MRLLLSLLILIILQNNSVLGAEENSKTNIEPVKISPGVNSSDAKIPVAIEQHKIQPGRISLPIKVLDGNRQVRGDYENIFINRRTFHSERLMNTLKELILSHFPQVKLTVSNNELYAAYKTHMVKRKCISMPQHYFYKQVEEPKKGGILIKVTLSEFNYTPPCDFADDPYRAELNYNNYGDQVYSKKYKCYIVTRVLDYNEIGKNFLNFLNSLSKIIKSFETYLE